MLSLRATAVCVLFCLGVGTFAGCGGGLSGPDSNTSAGLGILVVSVAGAGNAGTVSVESRGSSQFQIARPTRDGKANFYNIPPGRYPVTASAPSSFNDRRNVDIVADKTLSISLSPTGVFQSTASATPSGI